MGRLFEVEVLPSVAIAPGRAIKASGAELVPLRLALIVEFTEPEEFARGSFAPFSNTSVLPAVAKAQS